tara:strand:+ start:1148 stop:1330 length:183 start_codon:yes stop_codon:yes gene_type:complete
MNCWFCTGEMRWECDFDYKDWGKSGDGVIANLSCTECDAFCEFYLPLDNKEEDSDDRRDS